MIQELPLNFLDTPLSEVGTEIAEELELSGSRSSVGHA